MTGAPPETEAKAKRASYLIVDRHLLGDLDRTVPTYREEAIRFIEDCSRLSGVIDDPTYGKIEVRRLTCLDNGRSSDVTQGP